MGSEVKRLMVLFSEGCGGGNRVSEVSCARSGARPV